MVSSIREVYLLVCIVVVAVSVFSCSFFTDVDDHVAIIVLLLVVLLFWFFFSFAFHRCSIFGTIT